jgi:hypothetical protein
LIHSNWIKVDGFLQRNSAFAFAATPILFLTFSGSKISMRKKYLFLAVFLAFNITSFAQDNEWDVYMAQYEKGIGSTIINLSLKEKAPLKQFPYLLQIGVKLITCNKEGLPGEDEFETLYGVSDTMKAITDALVANHAAGTFSYQCQRTDYYYIADTNGVRKAITQAFEALFPNYSYTIKLQPDPNWQAYLEFLYPNEVSFEYMQNEKVILALQKAGDKLQKPRQVDHWIYFKSEADREQFIAFVLKENYKVEKKEQRRDGTLPFTLQISRVDRVDADSISLITIVLRKKAKELFGDYDGWETSVVN